ncbi:MAG: hypothetical protein HYU39_05415 [Thaumarchaeota archaeon]|nr:hypothetical protein [Nitrososphaerota archaeon]
MSEFSKKWVRPPQEPGLQQKAKEAFFPAGPLKPRLQEATRMIDSHSTKLDKTIAKLKEREASLFKRATVAIQRHDSQTASAISNEVAEVRKMSKMVTQAKIAMQQIGVRLGTVQELGDIAATLAPAMGIIRSVRIGLTGVIPNAENEIGEISNMLGGMLLDVGQINGLTLNFEAANEEAQKILTEASAVAEQGIKDKFPDLPMTSMATGQQEQS